MIYAEWMENDQFHQREFDTWDRFHECFFDPEKELTWVHDNTPTEYQRRKEAARDAAIEWQYNMESHHYSYGELADWQDYFTRLGRRYGLLREFRENGII